MAILLLESVEPFDYQLLLLRTGQEVFGHHRIQFGFDFARCDLVECEASTGEMLTMVGGELGMPRLHAPGCASKAKSIS